MFGILQCLIFTDHLLLMQYAACFALGWVLGCCFRGLKHRRHHNRHNGNKHVT